MKTIPFMPLNGRVSTCPLFLLAQTNARFWFMFLGRNTRTAQAARTRAGHSLVGTGNTSRSRHCVNALLVHRCLSCCTEARYTRCGQAWSGQGARGCRQGVEYTLQWGRQGSNGRGGVGSNGIRCAVLCTLCTRCVCLHPGAPCYARCACTVHACILYT